MVRGVVVSVAILLALPLSAAQAQPPMFPNQQQYPQQQLSFMNSLLRGLPLSSTNTTQYQAPPSMTSQLAGLGMGAYGLSKLGGKKGGLPKDFEKKKIKKDDTAGGLQALALSQM